MENTSELKEILIKLKKEIPYKWRVQSYSKKKPQCTCVAYIDSRDVQELLDEHCLWSDRYYSEDGKLFCEITIYADGREYKRSDTGSESQAEAEKGHSSDAFKRAAVKFGVGRFLYSLGLKYVAASEVKTSNNYPFPVDQNGNRIYDLTKHINSGNTSPKNIEAGESGYPNKGETQTPQEKEKKWLNVGDKAWQKAIDNKMPLKDLREYYKVSKANGAQYEEELKKAS